MTDSHFKDPDVTPLCPCPNCSRLLRFDMTQCPDCRELIDDEYRFFGTVFTAAETQACGLANTIGTGDPGVYIVLSGDALGWLLGFGWFCAVYFVVVGLALGAIARWYWRYGRLPLAGDDFAAARQSMWRSFLLWLALGFFQIAFVLYSWRLSPD